MRSVESHVDMQQPVEALAQQSRTDQQHDGDGEFNHHEISAQSPPHRPAAAAIAVAQAVVNRSEKPSRSDGVSASNTGGEKRNAATNTTVMHIESYQPRTAERPTRLGNQVRERLMIQSRITSPRHSPRPSSNRPSVTNCRNAQP